LCPALNSSGFCPPTRMTPPPRRHPCATTSPPAGKSLRFFFLPPPRSNPDRETFPSLDQSPKTLPLLLLLTEWPTDLENRFPFPLCFSSWILAPWFIVHSLSLRNKGLLFFFYVSTKQLNQIPFPSLTNPRPPL